jgi:cell fate (sporulation/competence/biofilm development) regulator YlbF (YheA/YmcA/DUF963 family)
MPDTQQILDEAAKLGKLVAQHPSVAKYRDAQKVLTEDRDATNLMAEFNRQIETLSRQEASGMPITDAQRSSLESVQTQLASHIKVKALQLAQVEYTDLLRKVNQAVHQQLAESTPAGGGAARPGGGAGPKLVI